ncbi:ceramide-1-phosphate transfer protein [Rhodnius prolixus]|uniref:GLTP domain-containing protein n=1 Tax=Rhodnius prolixus TaxID=13249 RepID=T1HXB8_RHOPR
MEVNNLDNEHSDSKYCNLRFLSNSLNSCLLDGDDIHLGHYLDSYKELKKFCHLMGSVFGFVASEIESKTGILEQFRKEDECGNFVTMKNMIKHEKDQGVLKNINYISGCRTLLLLNRGLDFLKTFLQRISKLNPNEGTASVGKQSYEETLAHHHVWYVRAGARLAMITMPSKQNLLNYVLGDTQDCMLQYLPEVVEAANRVHARTYNTLKAHNLLELA